MLCTDAFLIYRSTKKQPSSSLKIPQVSQLWSLPWTNWTATSTPPWRSHTILRFKLQWSSHARRSTVIIQWQTFHQHIELQWVSNNWFFPLQPPLTSIFSPSSRSQTWVLPTTGLGRWMAGYCRKSCTQRVHHPLRGQEQYSHSCSWHFRSSTLVILFDNLKTNYSPVGWWWQFCYLFKYLGD